MAPKDKLTRLRADAAFKKLSPAHQQVLVDYCEASGLPTTPAVREDDAVLLADALVAVDDSVRDTLVSALKGDPNEPDKRPPWKLAPRLVGMTGTTTWAKPVLNKAPAGGADVSACRRRLVQVFALLARREATARGSQVKALLTNTIEWFIFANLPIEFATSSDGALMGEYVKERHAMVLYHESMLKIRPDGIGDERETVRKLAHEVNHACRRKVEDEGDGTRLVDELFAYVTELIAVGNVVTEAQIAETFRTLADPPYNLKKVIESRTGQDYRASIRYQGSPLPQSNPVIFPLPSPGTATTGWQHTNAVPGL